MKNDLPKSLLAVAFAVAFCASSVRAEDAKSTEPLALNLPIHTLKGTPEDLPVRAQHRAALGQGAHAFPGAQGRQERRRGQARHQQRAAVFGRVEPDYRRQEGATDDDAVEFKKGTQWVQVDLGQSFAIHAVAMWHDHRYVQAMHDVILQVSDDPEFKSGVTTLFNNDTDNSSGLGVGTDREYFEMEFGRVVAGKGVKARYVRGYTKGSNQSALNCWQEIEVYALPAK